MLFLVAVAVSALGFLRALGPAICDTCASRTPEWQCYGLFYRGAAVAALTIVLWVAGSVARRWFSPPDDDPPI